MVCDNYISKAGSLSRSGNFCNSAVTVRIVTMNMNITQELIHSLPPAQVNLLNCPHNECKATIEIIPQKQIKTNSSLIKHMQIIILKGK